MSQKPLVHFTHANGVPTASYKKLLRHLNADVITLPLIAHTPETPIEQEWDKLVDQLIESVRSQANGRPVIGVGHSLGGALHFMAAHKAPELYKGLILMEPALMGRSKLFARSFLDVGIKLGLAKEPPLYRVRRNQWPSRADAEKSLSSKAVYKHFDPECLRDYLTHGLVDQPDGSVKLLFDAQNESSIYKTAPKKHISKLSKPLPFPGFFIRADNSFMTEGDASSWLSKQHGFSTVEVQGTHFFPLESPEAIAERINRAIELIEGAWQAAS